MLEFWSKTQAIVALSSAEAELGAAVKASLEVLGMMLLWKDMGGTTRGRVMGDASAASGKGKTFEHELVVGPGKEASRELEHHKVKGSDNSADLFTKALDHDSIRRHTEFMGSEFACGRDPLVFTVNHPSATLKMERRWRSSSGQVEEWTL